ncbi:MAG: hypothetical protein QM785_15060 [Pyrinomonadaceae bacterium]
MKLPLISRVLSFMAIRKLLIGGVLGAGLAAYFILVVGGEFFRFHGSNALNRERLMLLRQDLDLGADYDKVLKSTWPQIKDSGLYLSPYSPDCWIVSMPPEITTTDWRLYIGFSDEKVAGYVVRTSDGPPATDGPADIGESRICGF